MPLAVGLYVCVNYVRIENALKAAIGELVDVSAGATVDAILCESLGASAVAAGFAARQVRICLASSAPPAPPIPSFP